MQQEIEANRRRLQQKEERKQHEEELKEAKLRAQREQKDKERQEPQAYTRICFIVQLLRCLTVSIDHHHLQ